MRKILYYLRENLEVTTREARSTLAFLLTALISIGVYITVNFMTRSEYARYTVEKYAVPLAKETPPFKEKGSFKEEESTPENGQKFRFDPNKAGLEQLTALGIPPRTAHTILNYRNKGGKFRYREDLQKIYSLRPETYAGLESWIDLPPKAAAAENRAVKKDTHTVSKKTAAPRQELSFDINTADTTTLKKLKGIGSVLASRIIRFRDALGGFHSLEQLDETYGIPADVLLSLKKAAVISTPVKQIPINETETFRHPYLKAYQVKALLAYRRQHGKFSSVEDLAKIKVLDEETIQKIKPYFSF